MVMTQRNPKTCKKFSPLFPIIKKLNVPCKAIAVISPIIPEKVFDPDDLKNAKPIEIPIIALVAECKSVDPKKRRLPVSKDSVMF